MRQEEDQLRIAAARDSNIFDPVHNVGDFTHKWCNNRPHALVVPVGLFYDGMLLIS